MKSTRKTRSNARALISTFLALVLGATVAQAQAPFSIGGPGGAIPAAGTGGGGSWPTTAPTTPFVSSSTTPVPDDGCQFVSLDLIGLSHTWIGDLHIVLNSPTGQSYTIVHRPGFTGTGAGNSGDCTGGIYRIVASGGATIPTAGDWTGGIYNQDFGSGAGMWPSGDAGIYNVALDGIVAETGQWNLAILDWSGGDAGSLTGWTLHGVRGVSFLVTGPGGPIPSVGNGGGGTWPSVLPPAEFSSTSGFTPAGFCKIRRVVIYDLTHTWVGDLQAVLYRPDGIGVNLVHRPGFIGSGAGNSGDATGGGLYSFFSPGSPGTVPIPTSGNWTPGSYANSAGSGGGEWPDNTHSIRNGPLGGFSTSAGNWRLAIYDWAGGDSGSCTSWAMVGYFVPIGPLHYCTAGTTSHGCAASISASATPSSSYANSCLISVSGVEGQKNGLLFYSVDGRDALPFGGGYLCTAPPRQRTTLQNSGGAANQCNGTLQLDWNLYRLLNPSALGAPWSGGSSLFVQGWYREPGSAGGTNLSDAVQLTHTP